MAQRRPAGRGRPPQAAARRAGLKDVEKLLPTNLTSTDTTEWNAGMLPRPAPSHCWPSWLLAVAPRRPGGRCRCPPEARPQLLGHDLDHRPDAAILSRPAPLLEPAHDHDPAAPAHDESRVVRMA